MACPDALELQSYVDGEVTPERRHALEDHLHGCASCRAQVKTLQAVAAVIAADRDAAQTRAGVSEALEERLLKALGAAHRVRRLSCRRAAPMLSAYVDGELPSRDVAALEAHTFACEKCFAALSEMRTVATTLAERPRAVASEQLLARTMAALRREAAAASAGERIWRRRLAWQPLAAGVAAAAVILAVVVSPRFTAPPSDLSAPPAIVADGTPGMMGETPMPPAATDEAPAPPSAAGAATAPVTAAQPGLAQRLENALTGRGAARQAAATRLAATQSGVSGAAPSPTAPTAAYAPPAPLPGAPETRPATPVGRPVATSVETPLPGPAPMADRRIAVLPRTEASGLGTGDEHPRMNSVAASAVGKALPSAGGAIALASAPAVSSPGPELAPRRAPMREAYRSEGIDRGHLERSADRLNKTVPLMRIAGRTNIEIIH